MPLVHTNVYMYIYSLLTSIFLQIPLPSMIHCISVLYTPHLHPIHVHCIWYICSWLHLINILDFDQLIVCAVFDYFYIEWNSFNFTSAWSMRISLCIPRCLGICQNPVQTFAFFTPASLNLPKSLDRYLLQSSLSKHDKAM